MSVGSKRKGRTHDVANKAKRRSTRIASCPTNKRGFASKAAAKDGLVKLRSKRRRQGDPNPEQSTYRCEQCGFWHLSSMTPEAGRASARRRVAGAEYATGQSTERSAK